MALKDMTAIYADIYKHNKDNSLKDGLVELQAKVTALAALVNDLKAKYNAATNVINEMRGVLSVHAHGGVTTGTGVTAVSSSNIDAPSSVATTIPNVTI